MTNDIYLRIEIYKVGFPAPTRHDIVLTQEGKRPQFIGWYDLGTSNPNAQAFMGGSNGSVDDLKVLIMASNNND